MKQQLKSKLDKMQMEVVKECKNIEDVQTMIGIFAQMNKALDAIPESMTAKTSGGGAKRGRKPKQHPLG
ncbi:hypothetical protein [Rufibacter sp. LB8]|uniref:hypothetical protein n=1 Tax=Rufibacter sp. LB8 TaxID=2777781 RepID=UPI00178C394A|nr:hypothetical protein [Rufibacter sp. LB8]